MTEENNHKPEKDPYHQTTSNVGAQEQIAQKIVQNLRTDLSDQHEPDKQERLETITSKFPRTTVKDTGN